MYITLYIIVNVFTIVKSRCIFRKTIFAKYTINKLAMYLYHILQRKFIDNIFKSNIKQINDELRT